MQLVVFQIYRSSKPRVQSTDDLVIQDLATKERELKVLKEKLVYSPTTTYWLSLMQPHCHCQAHAEARDKDTMHTLDETKAALNEAQTQVISLKKQQRFESHFGQLGAEL